MNHFLRPTEDPCIRLLEANADAIQSQMLTLVKWLGQPTRPRSPMVFSGPSLTSNEIKMEISKILTTGWHREDRIAMTEALSRIRRSLDVLGHRLTALDMHLDDLDLSSPIHIVEKAIQVVPLLVKQLRNVGDLQGFRTLLDRLGELQKEMEKVLDRTLEKAGSCLSPPLKQMARHDLLKAFYETVELCEQAGHLAYKLGLSCN